MTIQASHHSRALGSTPGAMQSVPSGTSGSAHAATRLPTGAVPTHDPRNNGPLTAIGATGTAIVNDFADPSPAQTAVALLSVAGTVTPVVDRGRLLLASPGTIAKIVHEPSVAAKVEHAARWMLSSALVGATNEVVPHDNTLRGPLRVGGAQIGRLRIPQHTFANGWHHLYTLENATVALYGVGQLGVGGFSIASGIRKGGARGIYDTRDGRDGLLQIAGGLVVGRVLVKTIRANGGIASLRSAARVGRMLADERWGRTSVAVAEFAPLLLSMVNEAGGFDYLDARSDDHRSAGQKTTDALHALPGKVKSFLL